MSAQSVDIDIDQGGDYERTLIFRDSANALIDLTGTTFEGKLRKTISEATEEASFTFTLRDQVTYKGQVYMKMANTITAAFVLQLQRTPARSVEVWCYDVYWIQGAVKRRVMEGLANISPESTK